MKITTYEITVRTTPEHTAALWRAGCSGGITHLRYDGVNFREGAFDVETWRDVNEALENFCRLADDSFGPGMEMVLSREIYDVETDEFETEDILVEGL
jgi:hypothetical protein